MRTVFPRYKTLWYQQYPNAMDLAQKLSYTVSHNYKQYHPSQNPAPIIISPTTGRKVSQFHNTRGLFCFRELRKVFCWPSWPVSVRAYSCWRVPPRWRCQTHPSGSSESESCTPHTAHTLHSGEVIITFTFLLVFRIRIWFQCGSGCGSGLSNLGHCGSASRSRVLMTKYWKKITAEKNEMMKKCNLVIPRPPL